MVEYGLLRLNSYRIEEGEISDGESNLRESSGSRSQTLQRILREPWIQVGAKVYERAGIMCNSWREHLRNASHQEFLSNVYDQADL